MIVLWGTAGVEVLLQMAVGLGMFLRAFGSNEDLGKVRKYVLMLLIFTNWLLGTYNATMCVFSISMAWFHVVLESIYLWGWSGRKFKVTFFWCVFYKWLFVVTKAPVLIISGLAQHRAVERVINCQVGWTALSEAFITLGIWFLYRHLCVKNSDFLQKVIEGYDYLLFAIGISAFLGVLYLIDVLDVEFEIYALVMAIIMMLMLMACMAIIIIYMRYKGNEREKQVVLSRTRILENNYEMLKQEQEINRKNIHDYRHTLEYLYHCFLEGDCERGCAYIEKQNKEYQVSKQKEIWTGNTGVDYLINKAKKETEEANIHFEVMVDVLELPIAEYDFFTVLGNLLENAIDAVKKCDIENRFIRLKLCMNNEMLMLYLENSYREEPIRNGERFVTLKRDNTMHGWGIESVKEIVAQYNGICSIAYKNSVFSFQIMFGIE